MAARLTKLELKIMEIFWARGPLAVREVQERLPAARRLAYTTVQTVMYRLEAKKALKRTDRVGNAHVFEAVISRKSAYKRLIDEVISLTGGNVPGLMSLLIDVGKLTLDDVEEAEARLRQLQKARASR